MSDEKNRDDSTRANELLSLLKKYWKIEGDEPDAANSVPEADKAVEKSTDGISAQGTDAALYDGIISNVDDVVGSKKKYRGIPDDEPLFVFDSFELSDENSDDAENGDEAAYIAVEHESDGVVSEAREQTEARTYTASASDASEGAEEEASLAMNVGDTAGDAVELGCEKPNAPDEENYTEQLAAHKSVKRNRARSSELVQMTFSMLEADNADAEDDVASVGNESVAEGAASALESVAAELSLKDNTASDGEVALHLSAEEESGAVKAVSDEADSVPSEPAAVSEADTVDAAAYAESQAEAIDPDSADKPTVVPEVGDNGESKAPRSEEGFAWEDINDFAYYGEDSDNFEIALTVIDSKELNGELSEGDGDTAPRLLGGELTTNGIEAETKADMPPEPDTESAAAREESCTELGDQSERASDQRFKGLFGNRRVGFGTRNGIAADTVNDVDIDGGNAVKTKENIGESGEDDAVSLPTYLTDVEDDISVEENIEIAEEFEEPTDKAVAANADAVTERTEENHPEPYESDGGGEAGTAASVAEGIPTPDEELFLPSVIEIVDDDGPVEPEDYYDEYMVEQPAKLAEERVEEKPRLSTADQAVASVRIGEDAVKTADNGSSDELYEPTELEEAVSFAEEYRQPIDKSESTSAVYELSEDPEEAPEIAEEVEELLLAKEITSETSAAKPTVTVEEKAAPYSDWTQDDGFLRECAQLELPKLSVKSRPVSEAESDEIPDAVSSGYSYTDAEKGVLSEHEIAERKAETAAKNRRKLHASRNKSFYAFILAAVTVIYECLGYFFGLKSAFSGEIPLLMFGLDVLLTALCIFILRDAFSELRSDVRKRLIKAELVGCMAVTAVLIYDIASIIALRGKIADVTPLGAVAAICTFLSILFSSVRLGQDIRIFNMTCQSKEYATLVRMEKNSAVPEYRELEGMVSPNAQLYCLNKVDNVNAACRDDRRTESETAFFAVFTASLWVLSIGFGALSVIKGASLYSGVRLAALLVLSSLPCSLLAAQAAARGRMLKRAAVGSSTVTGDEAVSELKNGAIVIIRDTELFPPENIKVKSYDVAVESLDGAPKTTSIERSLSHVVSLFKQMGGTLSGIFGAEESGIRLCDGVVFTDISEKGVSALIEGVYVRIGSAAYLGGYGIPVVADVTERGADERVLYASDNGVFCTKLVLSYKADKELCRRISRLRRYGVAVSVKTCDPCIDAALILSTAGLEPELVRVVRYSIADDREFDRSTREGGIVSFGGASGVFTALAACIKAKGALKLCRIITVMLSLIGGACVLLGAVLELKFIGSAIFVCVYQMLCALAAAFIARLK